MNGFFNKVLRINLKTQTLYRDTYCDWKYPSTAVEVTTGLKALSPSVTSNRLLFSHSSVQSLFCSVMVIDTLASSLS